MITFFSHDDCLNAYSVRLMMSILGTSFKQRAFKEAPLNEQHYATWAANGLGAMPVMHDGTLKLHQTTAMLTYLSRAYASELWMPLTPPALARVNQWLNIARGDWLPCTNQHLTIQQRWQRLDTGLSLIEQQLKSASWLIGHRPTIADIACYPLLTATGIEDAIFKDYPYILKWVSRVQTLPNFIPAPQTTNT
ncbi:glutathione S-transferase family protein [Zooshikella marina]|uniref:glutathione S-transferase family protein n=1 Tax=Zooshikella ganghwensis TaxID=202772 RepID=UPI001BB058F8|nr:glutathione S-transferase family protein [Zooshikella ganghwensis]MBU2705329.1 glutathione S-transferase family protein [Zooshikella ganghwensis]